MNKDTIDPNENTEEITPSGKKTNNTEEVAPLGQKTKSNFGAMLLILVGREVGKKFFLTKDEIILGRSKEADILVLDGKVSRRHTKIQRVPSDKETQGQFQVIDLGSTNGTFVRNKRITRKPLKHGDNIVLGDTCLQFLLLDAESLLPNQLYRIAITDSLTGLLNREFFSQELTKEFSRARRYHRDLSIALLDVDHFKGINEKFGQNTGDLALRELSFMIMDMTRREDSVARYGGEAFALIFPETSLEDSYVVCENIRKHIENYEFGLAKGLKVTVSIGIAACRQELNKVDELVLNAEMTLFHAKRSGRNCTVKETEDIDRKSVV